MPGKLAPLGPIQTGFRRGICEWHVEDPQSLKRNEVVESNVFEIAGYKWKLSLLRGYRNSCPPEMARIFLFSCNPQGIHSYVRLSVNCQKHGRESVERKEKVACPFVCIDKLEIPFDSLLEQLAPEAVLTVSVDLKNILEATKEEQRKSRPNNRTINLEVIEDGSIRQGMSARSGFGIASPDKKRHADVSGCSLVRLWAQHSLDHRYWLCKRSDDGSLVVNTCLSDVWFLRCFEDISDKSGGGFPWVTVFKEEKKSNESFQPVDADTILVFCMLCEESYADSAYIGHLLVQKRNSCQELLMRATRELICFEEGQEYRAYICNGPICGKEITHESGSLDECGIHSGSVVVLRSDRQEFEDSAFFDQYASNKSASKAHAESQPNVNDTSDPACIESDSTCGCPPNRQMETSGDGLQGVQVSAEMPLCPAEDTDISAAVKTGTFEETELNQQRAEGLGASGLSISWPEGFHSCGKTGADMPEAAESENSEAYDGRDQNSCVHRSNFKKLDAKHLSGSSLSPDGSDKASSEKKDAIALSKLSTFLTPADDAPAAQNGPRVPVEFCQAFTQHHEAISLGQKSHPEVDENKTPDLCNGEQTVQIHGSSEGKDQSIVCTSQPCLDPGLQAGVATAIESITRPVQHNKEEATGRSSEAVTLFNEAVRDLQVELIEDVCRELREPLIEEIKQVGSEVEGIRQTAAATCQEVCKANMLANIEIEQLSDNGVVLHLRDRDAHKVPMIADDFAKDNPIFLLNRHHQHRLRVSLAHKHQGDATTFTIKYISVKPSDGLELGLTISEAKPLSEGSEVVALLPLDLFQSARLLSGCPQFGAAEQRYVSMAVTIGIATVSHDPCLNSSFELKGEVLCKPVSRPDMAGIKCFKRFALRSWRNSPQWIRDGARGAVILASTAVVKSGPIGTLSPLASLGSVVTSLFVLPCFRLRDSG